MTMLEMIPQEFFDEVPVGAAVTLDGELLSALDEAPAGPWLAEMLASIDHTKLTSFELPTYVRCCARQASWANAQLASAVADLATRPDANGPDKEIALALREPVGAAQKRVWWSKRVRRMLPGIFKLFSAGDVSERTVVRLVEATGSVEDPELMAKIEERLLPIAGVKTPDELVRAARDALKRLDPTGEQRRAKAARDEADVIFEPATDGMGDVIVHAPIENATLIKTATDAYAATAKAAGDTRPIGVLRAEAPARWASDWLTGRANGGQVPTAGGRPIEIGITLPLRTALGLDDLPGEIPGLGIIPRTVIAQMIRAELPKLRLLVTDPDSGRLLYRATSAYRPTAEQVAQVRATYVFSIGPGSKVLAVRCDTDHAQPHPVGPTVIGNLLPFDRTWHEGKTKGQLTVTVDDNGQVKVTTASGQSRTVTPYDYRMTDHHDEPPAEGR